MVLKTFEVEIIFKNVEISALKPCSVQIRKYHITNWPLRLQRERRDQSVRDKFSNYVVVYSTV